MGNRYGAENESCREIQLKTTWLIEVAFIVVLPGYATNGGVRIIHR
jgi:hypothetical protein